MSKILLLPSLISLIALWAVYLYFHTRIELLEHENSALKTQIVRYKDDYKVCTQSLNDLDTTLNKTLLLYTKAKKDYNNTMKKLKSLQAKPVPQLQLPKTGTDCDKQQELIKEFEKVWNSDW